MKNSKNHTFFQKTDLASVPEFPIISSTPKRRYSFKTVLIVFTLFFLTASIATLSLYSYWYVSSFANAAGLPLSYVSQTLVSGLKTSPLQPETRTNILLLGIDSIPNQKDNSLLTDTIIIISHHLSSQNINLISIPRDLWIDSLKTKVNALYYYGQQSPDTTGSTFASQIITEITGINFDYTFVVNLLTLEEIINTLGGVTVSVPETFTDDKFPRTDVDIHQVESNQLYETITFQQGIQHMDGQTALKYIRSRHSSNYDQGTDSARNFRQQQLLASILDRLLTKTVFTNPHTLGNLYRIVRTKMDTSSLTDISFIRLIKSSELRLKNFQLNTIAIPISSDQKSGLLFHPPLTQSGQWVYQPVDPSWQQLRSYLQYQLNSSY